MLKGSFARHSRADFPGTEVETFRRPATLIQRNRTSLSGLSSPPRNRSESKFVQPGGKFCDPRGGLSVRMVFGTSFY